MEQIPDTFHRKVTLTLPDAMVEIDCHDPVTHQKVLETLIKHCPACSGVRCKGGGNLQCIRRDPKPSHLAGIIDSQGGIRFVVTYPDDFRHHVKDDELLIEVPELIVHEPIAWHDIPHVIRRIERAVDEWIEHHPKPNESYAFEAVKMYLQRKDLTS